MEYSGEGVGRWDGTFRIADDLFSGVRATCWEEALRQEPTGRRAWQHWVVVAHSLLRLTCLTGPSGHGVRRR